MLARIVVAILLLVGTASAQTMGTGNCPTTSDYNGAWLSSPEASGCAAGTVPCSTSGTVALNRWTIDRMARAGGVATWGSDEHSFGLAGSISPDIPPPSSSSFALYFHDGRMAFTWDNLIQLMNAVRLRAEELGTTPPKFYLNRRWDLLSRHELSRTGAHTPARSWVLRTPRPLSDFAAAFRNDGAFAENDPDC